MLFKIGSPVLSSYSKNTSLLRCFLLSVTPKELAQTTPTFSCVPSGLKNFRGREKKRTLGKLLKTLCIRIGGATKANCLFFINLQKACISVKGGFVITISHQAQRSCLFRKSSELFLYISLSF